MSLIHQPWRSRVRAVVVLGLLMATAGCSPSAVAPTPPASPAPGPGASAAAQLTVAIDSLGSEEAIAGLSEVAADASGSTGAGPLTYQINFGDGTTVTMAAARHVYTAPGTYSVAATVTDSSGRATAVSKQVVARAVSGAWLHAGYSPGSREVLVRRLRLTSQSGTTVRGVVALPNQPDRPVNGELVPPRTLRLTFDDPAFGSLEGVLPGVLGPTTVVELRATGGPANGEPLAFRPMEGEPVGPPPDAVLNQRFFSFAAPYGIQGFSPILFDGATSRGDGLTYFLEFGDGGVSAGPTAVHQIAQAGRYTARLTVIDRFGRSDSEERDFGVVSLVDSDGSFWRTLDSGLLLTFTSQPDHRVAGLGRFTFSSSGSPSQPFSGELIGDHDVRLRMDGSGIVLAGTLTLANSSADRRMLLTQSGGPDHGKTYVLHFAQGH